MKILKLLILLQSIHTSILETLENLLRYIAVSIKFSRSVNDRKICNKCFIIYLIQDDNWRNLSAN